MARRWQVLGPLQVDGDSAAVPPRPAQRRLLCALLLDAGREVPRDVLIDRLWGAGAPDTAVNTLQAHVSGLRRSVGEVLQTGVRGYRLDVRPDELDVGRFDAAADRARGASREGDWEGVRAATAEALALWRGDPWEDVAGLAFAQPEVARLRRVRDELEELAALALLELGNAHEAAGRFAAVVAARPADELAWERLMLAEYRAGRQVAALEAFDRARAHLEDMGLEPGPRLQDLQRRVLRQDPSLDGASLTPTRLPVPATRFVGRRAELASVVVALDQGEPVTVVGPPGIGKTRLAVEVGRRRHRAQGLPAWFVRLVGARSSDDVVATIAAALGVPGPVATPEDLAERLAGVRGILVLDNAEHVRATVGTLVTALQARADGLEVLVTSRTRLGVPAERLVTVAALAVPAEDDPDAQGTADGGAVELLLDRVAALAPQLVLDDRGRRAAAQLCRQVGGVPLAIELVARRVPQLGLRDVHRLLATAAEDPDAPTSLAAAVGWSLDLLLPSDREVFDGLSVFEGPFELAVATTVVAPEVPESTLVGAVVRLVEASLVTVESLPGGEVRHRLLEPLRDVARHRLEEAGRSEEVRGRHAEAFRQLAVAEGSRARGPDEAAAFARLDAVVADVRGALSWLSEHGDGIGVATVAAALTRWWYARFLGWEGQRWISRALSLGVDDDVRPTATWAAGFLAYAVHDYDEADARFREALALAEDAGDRRAAGDALYGLGRTHLNRVDEDGRALLARAEELLADDPDRTVERAECVLWQGLDDAMRGDPERGAARLREAATILAAHGYDRQESKARRWTAHAERRRGDLAACAREAEAAERLARGVVDQPALAGALIERAHVHLAAGDRRAARAALAEALRPIPVDQPLDLCAVYTGVVCVLAADDPALALAVCGHVDAQYARARRRPLGEEVEVAGVRDRLRDSLGAGAAAEAEARGRDLPVRAMRAEVLAALAP